jgi:hypothetical protein
MSTTKEASDLADQPGGSTARQGADAERREPYRRRDHAVRGLDALRLYPHHLVRVLDHLRVEEYPFGLLTMIVSLEAIFLSTFILISQNRADEKRQVVDD